MPNLLSRIFHKGKLNVTCRDLIGFAPLPRPYIIDDLQPLLSDYSFARRKEQILHRQVPDSNQIERIYSELTNQHFDSQELDRSRKSLTSEIETLLGWKDIPFPSIRLPEWTQSITKVGNSSEGNDFEKLVRKGLIEIDFLLAGSTKNFSILINVVVQEV